MKLEFVIENKNSVTSKAVLLGSNHLMFIQNFGSDKGIDITCLVNDFEKLDYLKLLHQMMINPSWVESVMYNRFLLTPNYGSNIGVYIWVMKTFDP